MMDGTVLIKFLPDQSDLANHLLLIVTIHFAL